MGKNQEFAAVYDEHVWTIYAFLAYRTGSRADAEDLTQLTFERALRAWRRFDAERGGVAQWLMTIARNLLVDHYRSDRSARNQPLDDAEASAAGTEPGPEDAEWGISPELAGAIAALGDREREIIALRYGGDLTGPEIAEMTGLSLANVQQINSRALRKLRDLLAGVPA